MVISRASLTMRWKSQGGALPSWRERLAIPVRRGPIGVVIVIAPLIGTGAATAAAAAGTTAATADRGGCPEFVTGTAGKPR